MEPSEPDIEMAQPSSKERKAPPQLSQLSIDPVATSGTLSITSPSKTATTSQSRDSIQPPWTPAAETTGTDQSRESSIPPWTPTAEEFTPEIAVGMSIKAVRPPRPISKDLPRPSSVLSRTSTIMTASTKRLTFSRFEKKRPIKYGVWKDKEIELVPQPSDNSEDPLVSSAILSSLCN